MINLKNFLEKHNIKFQTEQKGLNWVKRRLKPDSLFRIGNSYFANEDELLQLLEVYAERQIKQRKRLKQVRAKQARKNFKKSTLSFQEQLLPKN